MFKHGKWTELNKGSCWELCQIRYLDRKRDGVWILLHANVVSNEFQITVSGYKINVYEILQSALTTKSFKKRRKKEKKLRKVSTSKNIYVLTF